MDKKKIFIANFESYPTVKPFFANALGGGALFFKSKPHKWFYSLRVFKCDTGKMRIVICYLMRFSHNTPRGY